MQIIIFGATEMGHLIASNLYQKHDITLIDTEEFIPEKFNKFDVSYVSGNGSNISTLETSGIKEADIFIACSYLDEANIVASWTAKKLSGIETVSFISKSDYLESLRDKNVSQTEFGIDHVLWPEELLSQDILRIITVPEALDVEVFAGGKARLFEYKIKENSIILNKRIKDCEFSEKSVVVGVTRDDTLFIPNGSTELLLDDKVLFMGTEQALSELARNIFKAKKSIHNVTIIGGGDVGYITATQLEKIAIKTKLIEVDKDRCKFLSEHLKKTLVLHGDGTDIELLESEYIDDSDVLICVTNNDEKNLLCSLLAKQLGVKRVLTRVSKFTNIALFEKVGIDIALSPKESSFKEIRDRLIETNLDLLAIVGRGQGEVINFQAPEKLINKKLMEFNLPQGAIIGAIQRKNKVIIPRGNTVVKQNDSMLVFTTADMVEKIKEFFTK